MAVKGVFTSDAGIVGDRKGDFASSLLRVMPTGSAQLLALSSGMESHPAMDPVVTWFEENHISGRINATNSAGTGSTVIVSDASFVIAGSVFLVEASGEHIFINSVSGSTLTVTRGFAGTTITSFDGSSTPVPIQRIGTAFEEASSRPTGVANLGYPRYNFVQIFRNAWDVSGTARQVQFYTGDVVAKNQADAGFFHAEDIERALWFSKRSVGHLNTKPFRTMDGIDSQITVNVEAATTPVSYVDLRNFLEAVFARNIKGKPNERIAFCGNTVLGVIDTLAMTFGVMNLKPGATEFGMKVTKWMTPFGDISLMTHPLFNESPLWTKDLYVLHPGAIRMRWLRRTKHDPYDRDGSRAGVDADFGVYTSELCIEYKADATGGKYTGIDTAAVAGLDATA
jgi:hypothetical protein